MTKTESTRLRVLLLDNTGHSEQEIAQELSISCERVRRILDSQETTILTLPAPKPVRDPPKKRQPRSTSTPTRVQRAPAGPRKQPPHVKTGQRVHGTEGGYNMHRRAGTEICDPCREAAQLKALKQRHAPRVPFWDEEEATTYLLGIQHTRMKIVRCTLCPFWHVMTYAGEIVPKESKVAWRKTLKMRKQRRAQQLTA